MQIDNKQIQSVAKSVQDMKDAIPVTMKVLEDNDAMDLTEMLFGEEG